LWYWDTGGSGHPVILLHAGTHSAAGWVYQQPVFAKAGYRVIAYSRRGYFRSEATVSNEPGTVADDLHCLVQHLSLKTVDLVAAAQGGFVALDYVQTYPERVRSFAVISSYMGITDADYAAVNARLRPAFFAAWIALEKQALCGERIPPVMKHKLTWAKLESIKHPALLMTGDSDLYTPPSLLRMQAQHMLHAEVHIVREAGHSPYWEQPEAFNAILLAFLAKQG
jgi:pimeloyl-ACP methyl ester carboxylesterase